MTFFKKKKAESTIIHKVLMKRLLLRGKAYIYITHKNKNNEIIVITKGYSNPSELSVVGYVCIKPTGIMPL